MSQNLAQDEKGALKHTFFLSRTSWTTHWASNREDLPYGLDILVTHEAPFGIFDQTGMGNWGSSHDLLQAIWEKRPKAREINISSLHVASGTALG